MSGVRDADDPRENFVYRLYNDDGDLLYIGCTDDVESRLMLHHVGGYSRVVSQAYPTRVLARAAERAAIATEAPLLNKQHNPSRFKGRKGGGFDPVEPIHPLTAQMLRNEIPPTREEVMAAMKLVSDRMGLDGLKFGGAA